MVNQEKTWRVGDTEIRVGSDGRFFAEIDGRIVRRSALSALKRLIEKDMSAVPIIFPDRGYSRWHLRKDKIVRVLGKGRLRGKRNNNYADYECVYLYDEKAVAKLEALLEKYEELKGQWDAVLRTMTRVTARNLDQFRERNQEK